MAEIVSSKSFINGIYTLEIRTLGKPFKYEPGQFLHLALDEYDPSGQWPDSRCFSMQSTVSNELIKITYAVKGNFTTRMKQELMPGKLIAVKLPYGNLFTQEHNKENTIFISGGTGITPYLSLFNDPLFASYDKPVLYAGFRNQKMNLYGFELEIAKQINPGLEIYLIYQDSEGMLDIERIYRESSKSNSFFISGPPAMITSFKTYLLKQSVKEDQIKTDDWE
ncbi:MAG TPA: hypothetical protein VFF57_09990 [Hanamia sp.]|nr:hypothetical protein [Hanamia sp.]